MKIIIEIIKMRNKSFLAILALVLGNATLYLFITNSQGKKLETLEKEWLDKRQVYSTGADTSLIYSQGKKDLATFYSIIPPKKDLTRVAGDLFEIASNNGLAIGSVGYKPEQIKGRDILVYTLNFSVTGGYAAIKSFISDMERSRDLISIDTISLKNDSPAGDSVNFSVRVSAFFRMEKP